MRTDNDVLDFLRSGDLFIGPSQAGADQIVEGLGPSQQTRPQMQLAIRRMLHNLAAFQIDSFDTAGLRCELRMIRLADRVLVNCRKTRIGRPARLGSLSDREREVLELLVDGKTNKQAAGVLFLSVRTVEKHRANIHRKMGTHSLAVLTRMYLAETPNPPLMPMQSADGSSSCAVG